MLGMGATQRDADIDTPLPMDAGNNAAVADDDDTYDKTQHVLEKERARMETMTKSLSRPMEDYASLSVATPSNMMPHPTTDAGSADLTSSLKSGGLPPYSTVNKVPKSAQEGQLFTLQEMPMIEDPLSELQACIDVLSNLENVPPPPIPPRTYGEVDEMEGAASKWQNSGTKREVAGFEVTPSAKAELMETAFGKQDSGLQQSTLNGGQAGSFSPLQPAAFGSEQPLLNPQAALISSQAALHSYETVDLV